MFLGIETWNKCEEIMLDSGGFSFFTKYSDYPFELNKYIEWIHNMNEANDGKVNYCAIRDYPCEPLINRASISTNKERIEKTVQNAIECIDTDNTINWMPVLQGYDLEEYLSCLDLYKDVGIIEDILAIGSMCRRTDIKTIEKIIRSIKKEYNGKIHLFGLTMNALKSKYIVDNTFSCDTIGYTFMCKTYEETEEKKEKLIMKYEKALEKQKQQKTLDNI